MKPEDESHESRCMSCGGMVDAKGMAIGGVVEGEDFAEDGVNLDGDTTQDEQADSEQAAARRSFVRAVKSRGVRT